MKSPRFARAAVVVSIATIALTGCSAGAASYAILDRAPQPSDDTPASLPDYASENMDLSTARYVGEHDGTKLWLGEGKDTSTVCLLAYPDDESWLIGCGSEGEVDGTEVGRFRFQPDGDPAPEGGTEISANVFAFRQI
ncbi:hypothetical protein [Microbacterium sp. BH-3-3-3]|uniref:hypothetical protein n=1 Tax=Microbacterium sp. BH-3-3-3 TaxID=1906742 RepID=UPI0012EA92CF|nr:hypothetical protein [Microbacterium sp. BH-3-3-3]